MVARKSLIEKPKKKDLGPVDEKKVSSRLNVDSLENAIVDGTFVAKVDDRLVVVKPRDGKLQKTSCIVKKIEGNEIHTWDETKNQWYIFSVEGVLKHGITVKKLSK